MNTSLCWLKLNQKKKFYAFIEVFRVDVNDVEPFQNITGRLHADHIHSLQSMPKNFQIKNKGCRFNFYYGGKAGYAHTIMIT